ncbi:Brix-domain-containing protein [Delitschia confertaspora ATCC 74209]|uniref:Ribosome production factor 2 homolog n=1 Tax=Delitschia confertaspora ATCC 74209 TaxID=1513339 RepID=A0A9P4MPA2_9PLEO|nr:Brix-domain-containing protein [Delitschia confertaspora ATCC 74209]
MLPIRTAKPKNARSKRALDKKAPQEHENAKSTLFLKGTKTSNVCQLAVKDLITLKNPFVQKFHKKNDLHPFVDASSLEFFSEKNDASLMVFTISTKKRPDTLTLIRTFNHKILDMLELHIDADSFRAITQFKSKKCASGIKPMIAFHGAIFDSPNQTKYTLAKSLFLDFFRGQEAQSVDVEGLQYMISISAQEEEEGKPEPTIHFRTYLIKTKKSGQKMPRVEVEEMGPRIDFRMGREKFPEEDMWKAALKKPKGSEPRTKKNIETDLMGDKIGKIHMGRQDFKDLQTRKMKGLKRGRNEDDNEDDETMVDAQSEGESVDDAPSPPAKKSKA